METNFADLQEKAMVSHRAHFISVNPLTHRSPSFILDHKLLEGRHCLLPSCNNSLSSVMFAVLMNRPAYGKTMMGTILYLAL